MLTNAWALVRNGIWVWACEYQEQTSPIYIIYLVPEAQAGASARNHSWIMSIPLMLAIGQVYVSMFLGDLRTDP